MWHEVQQASQEKRYELVLCGQEVNKLIEEAEGQLDPAVYDLTQLNLLKVTNSSLTCLSKDLARLVNLTNLVLQNNRLEVVPEAVGSLEKLKFLDVSSNHLTSLPASLGSLTSLTTLNVTGNQLTSLPSLQGCINLLVLDVSHNQLSEFPDICSSNLTHLTEVKLSNNRVDQIPVAVIDLPALKLLDAAHNNIKTVPGEFSDCSKLKELNLKGNPLSDRRFKKLVESERCLPRQVLDYIRQHCPRSSGQDGKGKKGKGKKNKSKDEDEVDVLCKELQVLGLCEREGVPSLMVTAAVKEVRPYLVCCVIHHLDLTNDLFKRFISLQTKLHDGICEKRMVATIATHDLAKIRGPLSYTVRAPKEMHIHPLGRGKEVSAWELYTSLQREAEAQRKQQKRNVAGLHRFLHMVEPWEQWPCLEDAQGKVISLPPITNSDSTKITQDTTSVLLEVTSSSSLSKAKEVADTLLLAILQNGLSSRSTEGGEAAVVVQQVRVEDEDGGLRVLYPSHTDLTFQQERIRVMMPVK